MGGRRKAGERREPNFDVTPEPDSRPSSRPDPKVEAADDEDEAPRKPRKRKKVAKGSKAKRASGGGRSRSLIGRVVYWGAVASLWAVIAVIGGIVWVGMHLPPIQSLEIPKRPPSFQIVDMNGRALATRGDMGG